MARVLKAVDQPPAPPADYDAVAKAATELPDGYLQCRLHKHQMARLDVIRYTDNTDDHLFRCSRCLVEYTETRDQRGYVVTRSAYSYAGCEHDYLMPPGMGRVGKDGNAALRREESSRIPGKLGKRIKRPKKGTKR
jgi:hypothetical protein